MDVDIGRWILEYLLRQPLDDRTLNSLVSILPLCNHKSNLKRTLLLRRIDSAIQNGTVSEELLEFLEQIEELNYREGVIVTESMKAAYCAVAVHCTLRFLEENEGIELYVNAVKRIWMNRVCKIGSLGSEELKGWKDEIEKEILDKCVRKKLVLRNYGNDAVEVVRVYVEEEKERLGPSFLELVAEKLGDYDTVKEVFGSRKNGLCDQVTENMPKLTKDGQNVVVTETIEEKRRGNVSLRSKHVGVKRCRGANISDTEGFEDIAKCDKINRVDRLIDSSSLKPQEAVKDPLSNALHLLAETAVASFEREKSDHEAQVGPSSCIDQCVDAVQADQSGLDNPSLMECNSTARSHEWDDSINNLPSPTKRVDSPLRKNEIPKVGRKKRRWSTLEEDTLRTGVQKFGKGNWKFILNVYRSSFEERTEVDLKDKWRNMTP